ncbi:ubiquitin protein ligase protein [Trichomonas vaginalis G3]|uniref:ubiquitin protein ligase protein n=1 Tax=Trichomonas vaginalis (strain ATCC PRA-98 / G3) TaxID=412133 RepID=UPI0021E58FB9|nr:ubiquitin protein ligase protein [Trichomonas vaginalis G3]KAI5489495.1 ubiquitin protein ligase protein [Trichomonas vaginalis G3]
MGSSRRIGHLKIDITKTHFHGVNYESPELIKIIDYLAKEESHFPSNFVAFRTKENKFIYYAEYEGSTGPDIGGVFRDSYFLMVEELMDIKIKYFVKPPSTLHCESDRLIPAPNMPAKVASTIGSLIASAIATQNPHKAWNLPRFIWQSFVTDVDISNLVHCDDQNYFNDLKTLVNLMRSGFWKVIPLIKVHNFSGEFIEGLARGQGKDLDIDSFLSYFTPKSKNTKVWPVFVQAVAPFTSQELSKLMRFITGNETPKITKGFHLELTVKETDHQDENNFWLPVTHTCFNSIEIMPYKTAKLLSDKLKFCISVEDELF